MNIRAGQERPNCRPITYEEREKIWRDAVALEAATRKKGCENGELGKSALAVLRSLLFDFTNMKTGVCFPRVRTLQEKLQPWFSRASIFRALDRFEAAGVLVRVHRRMRNAESRPGRQPVCLRCSSRKPRRRWRRRLAIWPRLRLARSGRHFGSDQSSQAATVPAENLIF